MSYLATKNTKLKPLLHCSRGFFYTFLTVIFFLSHSVNLSAQYYDMNSRMIEAYEHILQLEFEAGEALLAQEKLDFPDNLLVYHIENYIDFFTCFISEDKQEYSQRKLNKDIRLYYLEKGSEDSPYYLFSQAEVILQWALIRLKMEEYTTAIFEINKALKLLERNESLFPSFIANKKSLSALHALVGTIPPQYKNLLEYISYFNGTIQQGYEEIKEVVAYGEVHDFVFKKESIAIKALIELHLMNDKENAYQTIHSKVLDAKKNPLACFLKANISHKAGHNDQAIDILLAYKPSTARYPMYYLDYLTGVYKLNRLDPDSDVYIRKYLNYFNGRNYIKEAYQKIAWYEWVLHKNEVGYRNNLQYCQKYGYAITDEDKQAEKLAEDPSLPLDYLLKARLLSDGSYHKEALEILKEKEYEGRTLVYQIEYAYRRARIHSALNQTQKAKTYFKDCLNMEKRDDLYYQTASALYLGQLYEEENDFIEAAKYYKICLKEKPAAYKNSLHQKAKAGLQRIGNKIP